MGGCVGIWVNGWAWHETNHPSRAGQALFVRDTCVGQHTNV